MTALTRNQVLALLTAHPDTWELADVPDWLVNECRDLGLIHEVRTSVWKLTEQGYREWYARLQ